MSVDSLPTGDVPEPVGCFPNAGNSVRWFFLRVVPFGGAMLLAACGEPGEKDISTSEPAPLNPDQQVRRVARCQGGEDIAHVGGRGEVVHHRDEVDL